jgi:hypothetical protein
VVFSDFPHHRNRALPLNKYLSAAIAAGLTAIALGAHWKVQPYALPVLNKLQSFMYICITATLILIIPYSMVLDDYKTREAGAVNRTAGQNHSSAELQGCGEIRDRGICTYGWTLLLVFAASVVVVVVVGAWKLIATRRGYYSAVNRFDESQDIGVDNSADYHLMDGNDSDGDDGVRESSGETELGVYMDLSERDMLAGESRDLTEHLNDAAVQ